MNDKQPSWLNCIKESLGSNFGRGADYPGRDFFVIFLDRSHFSVRRVSQSSMRQRENRDLFGACFVLVYCLSYPDDGGDVPSKLMLVITQEAELFCLNRAQHIRSLHLSTVRSILLHCFPLKLPGGLFA